MRLRRKAVDIVVEDDGILRAPEESDARVATIVVDPIADGIPLACGDQPIHWTAPGVDIAGPVAPVQGAPSLIGEMLVARGLISREQLEHALAEQVASGLRLGSQLVE